jgi:hypothetical protein
MGTSYRRFCPITGLAHGGEHGLDIDQLTQFPESSNREAWFHFFFQLLTDEWIQHPLWQRQLQPIGKFHHDNSRGSPPQVAD